MRIWVIIALVTMFAVYLINLILGAMGVGVFLSDEVEMLVLLITCVAFVITMLYAEDRLKTNKNDS